MPRKPRRKGDYVNRLVRGVLDFEVFDYASDTVTNVLLSGDTGSGKTLAATAWAADRGLPSYVVVGNAALDPAQLFGKYVSDGAGGFEWVDGGVTKIVRKGGLLLLEELNFTPPKIATTLFPLLDARRMLMLMDHRGEPVTPERPNDLTIIATMNPDYIGTLALNAALRNRFGIQIEWGYDRAVEEHLVSGDGLLDLASRLRSGRDVGELETPTSTNMLMEFENLLLEFGWEFASDNFLAHFTSEERPAVRLLLETMQAAIDTGEAA